MKNSFVTALATLLFLSNSALGAICNFTGTIVDDNSSGLYGGAFEGDTVALSVAFNTVGGSGAVGAVTAATLTIGSQAWNLTGTTSNVSIVDAVGGDSLRVDLQLGDSAPGAFAGGDFDLSIVASAAAVSDSMLTLANIEAIKSNASFGNFNWQPSAGVRLLGSAAAVPEPSSVLLTTGFGILFLGSAVRRRRKISDSDSNA